MWSQAARHLSDLSPILEAQSCQGAERRECRNTGVGPGAWEAGDGSPRGTLLAACLSGAQEELTANRHLAGVGRVPGSPHRDRQSQAPWRTPVVPATWEAEARDRPGSSGPVSCPRWFLPALFASFHQAVSRSPHQAPLPCFPDLELTDYGLKHEPISSTPSFSCGCWVLPPGDDKSNEDIISK